MKAFSKIILVLGVILLSHSTIIAGWGGSLRTEPCPVYCTFSYSTYCGPDCPTCYCDPCNVVNCGCSMQ